MNPNIHSVLENTMPNAGSRRRIHLSFHKTFDEALAAKRDEKRYPQENLQIKKRKNGNNVLYDLMARISINTNTDKSVENN